MLPERERGKAKGGDGNMLQGEQGRLAAGWVQALGSDLRQELRLHGHSVPGTLALSTNPMPEASSVELEEGAVHSSLLIPTPGQ